MTFDGRTIGKQQQTFFGLVPLNLGSVGLKGPKKFRPQSCNAVFPLLIINKSEDSETINEAVPNLRAGITQLKAKGVYVGGEHHTVKFSVSQI